ncbi:hypothetical protein PSTT_08095 [Puccinia striiformis]|uniref:TOG domain-containing protein n=1 Tax=Puccinia striiformis TaxID=27350 RepID=A0A2S4VDV2_9BASI|nr:hypothetical protein PSTT_08095 [Puccinia striiformis]
MLQAQVQIEQLQTELGEARLLELTTKKELVAERRQVRELLEISERRKKKNPSSHDHRLHPHRDSKAQDSSDAMSSSSASVASSIPSSHRLKRRDPFNERDLRFNSTSPEGRSPNPASSVSIYSQSPSIYGVTSPISSNPRSSPSKDIVIIMSLATIQALEIVIAGTDNEKKVLRLNALREELESLESPPDLQPLLGSLKSSLESSNGHLSYAALACLTPLARTLAAPAHQSTLKQLVLSLYSPASNSVASFLGDAKQRTRETARSALFAAASAACEAHTDTTSQSSPRTEDVLQEIERIVKEQGFASKIARARVQTLCYLSEIRSRYPALIPFKTYLPSLVSMLEDSDVTVRTAASDCVTTVYSDPSLPPSARGDLKNELAKQGTRRSTVDTILAKVFSTTSNPPKVGSSNNPLASSQSGLPGSEPPPSSGIIHPVFVSGPRELESIFAKMLSAWEGKETEHNWQAREANVNTLRGMIKTNVHMQYTADFIAGLKSVSEGLLKSLASLRTTMAVAACNAFLELSTLGPALDPLVDTILPALLRMAAQTKKLVVQASQAAARIAGISRIKEFLDFHGQRAKSQIESGGGLGLIEKALRRSLADASPLVRETAREVFWNCSTIWPQMTSPLIESLDGPTRKQLEKASTGRPAASSTLFKSEKEPSSRVSVRSLIKSTRSAHRATENPNPPQSTPLSPRKVSSNLGGIALPMTKSMSASSTRRTPERQGTSQSPGRDDLRRSLSAQSPVETI